LVNQEKGARVFYIIIKRSKETVERITYGLLSRSEIELERMLESSPSVEDPASIMEGLASIIEDPAPIIEDLTSIIEKAPRRKRRRTTLLVI
jgi:hypothetical protein